MNINVFYDDTGFRLREKKRILKLIEKVILDESGSPGDLNFIFTSDKELLKINRTFLKHNYFTDVITFGYAGENGINGEIYISADRVRKNANNYKVSLISEVIRVMVHGTLHLCGYEDTTDEERSDMRVKEDKWIEEFRRD